MEDRVLIVEANEVLRTELVQHYEAKNKIVFAVDKAYTALKVLSMNSFDLVVTDLNTATISSFFKQVKSLSDAKLICSTEIGLTGTPSYKAGQTGERHQLRVIN